ncbi:AraC family transcriptional regulator [Salmonella enterica]|nr:AraC family transcriptional regulator [Salmonella enterica]
MVKSIHHIVQHRTGLSGVDAMSMLTEHSFPRHSHDQFGIGIMTMGAQRSWSSLGKVESHTGDIIMVNPGEMHDGAPIDGVRGWHIVYLDPGVVRREVANDIFTGDLEIRPVAQDPLLAGEILRFFRELSDPTPDHFAREEALLCFLMRVMQRHTMGGPRNANKTPGTLLAVQRLEDESENPVSLASLADLCGLSRFQLLRSFSREMGVTPHAYLIQLRVRKARRLLATGKSPVEVALLTGFADQSHLTRAFVRQFGVTPGRYQAAIL